MNSYISGLIIGFLVALPVGTVCVLCVTRSLQYGKPSGYSTGLGAAAADLIYGIIAIYGLTSISGQFLVNQPVLRLAGGFCIVFIGMRMMVKQVYTAENVVVSHENNIKDFVSTFFITLSNPITMLAFIAALSNINHLFDRIDFFQSTLIVLGIFSGSMLWWIILINIALHFKKHLNDVYLKRINMVSGFFILSIGFFLIITIKT